jgi:hypothetical protein
MGARSACASATRTGTWSSWPPRASGGWPGSRRGPSSAGLCLAPRRCGGRPRPRPARRSTRRGPTAPWAIARRPRSPGRGP